MNSTHIWKVIYHALSNKIAHIVQNSYLRFMWNKEPEMRRSEWTWGEAEKLVAMIKMYSNPDYDEKMLLEFAQLAVRKYFIRLMNLNINKTFSHKNVHLRNKYVLYISSYLWIGKR